MWGESGCDFGRVTSLSALQKQCLLMRRSMGSRSARVSSMSLAVVRMAPVICIAAIHCTFASFATAPTKPLDLLPCSVLLTMGVNHTWNLSDFEGFTSWPLITTEDLGKGTVLRGHAGSGILLLVNMMRPVLSSSNFELWLCDHLRAPFGWVGIFTTLLLDSPTVGALAATLQSSTKAEASSSLDLGMSMRSAL